MDNNNTTWRDVDFIIQSTYNHLRISLYATVLHHQKITKYNEAYSDFITQRVLANPTFRKILQRDRIYVLPMPSKRVAEQLSDANNLEQLKRHLPHDVAVIVNTNSCLYRLRATKLVLVRLLEFARELREYEKYLEDAIFKILDGLHGAVKTYHYLLNINIAGAQGYDQEYEVMLQRLFAKKNKTNPKKLAVESPPKLLQGLFHN